MTNEKKGDLDNTFRILLATDLHLGYCDRDPERGNDTLVTFEEILQKARELEVDLLLLGGDLFHENKPPRRILHSCLALLREYCLGDKPVQFKVLSDQSVNFEHCSFPNLNYEDPNLNVSLPVFSIHGNHDDPTGPGNLCSLDLLHTAGLVNYFGKTTSLEKIQLTPLLLEKGQCRLALYGLGALRGPSLHRLLVNNKMVMLRPREDKETWFNLLVLHQNRAERPFNDYVPENLLADFLDLVFWGHEHECRIKPEWNRVQAFHVTQPGSSVATSLRESESKTKHIGLLTIRTDRSFKVEQIPLQTVRPFYFDTEVLSDMSIDPKAIDVFEQVETFCVKKVEDIIAMAAAGRRDGAPTLLPLIRLKVDYTQFDVFSLHRFSQRFQGRVANPKTILKFFRTRRCTESANDGDLLSRLQPKSLERGQVEDMVRDYFAKANYENKLHMLDENRLGISLRDFVDKGEGKAISHVVNNQIQETQDHLMEENTEFNSIDITVRRFRETRLQQETQRRTQNLLMINEDSVSQNPIQTPNGDKNENRAGNRVTARRNCRRRATGGREESGGSRRTHSVSENGDGRGRGAERRGRGCRGRARGRGRQSAGRGRGERKGKGRGARSGRERERGGGKEVEDEGDGASPWTTGRRRSGSAKGSQCDIPVNGSRADLQRRSSAFGVDQGTIPPPSEGDGEISTSSTTRESFIGDLHVDDGGLVGCKDSDKHRSVSSDADDFDIYTDSSSSSSPSCSQTLERDSCITSEGLLTFQEGDNETQNDSPATSWHLKGSSWTFNADREINNINETLEDIPSTSSPSLLNHVGVSAERDDVTVESEGNEENSSVGSLTSSESQVVRRRHPGAGVRENVSTERRDLSDVCPDSDPSSQPRWPRHKEIKSPGRYIVISDDDDNALCADPSSTSQHLLITRSVAGDVLCPSEVTVGEDHDPRTDPSLRRSTQISQEARGRRRPWDVDSSSESDDVCELQQGQRHRWKKMCLYD